MDNKILKELKAMAKNNRKEIKVMKKGRANKVNVNVIEKEDKELEEAFKADIQDEFAEAVDSTDDFWNNDALVENEELTLEDICEILRSLTSEDYRIVLRASKTMRKADKILERVK